MSIDQDDVEYVGFWPRVGAALIDTVLLALVTTPLLLAVYGWTYYEPAQDLNIEDPNKILSQLDLETLGLGFKGPADFLIQYVAPAIAVVMFWIYLKATPGKMAIRAEVVDAKTLGPLSVGQSVVRYLGYYVSSFPCGLGLIWVAFDPMKQGWHDKLAGTVVIYKRHPTERDELIEA